MVTREINSSNTESHKKSIIGLQHRLPQIEGRRRIEMKLSVTSLKHRVSQREQREWEREKKLKGFV